MSSLYTGGKFHTVTRDRQEHTLIKTDIDLEKLMPYPDTNRADTSFDHHNPRSVSFFGCPDNSPCKHYTKRRRKIIFDSSQVSLLNFFVIYVSQTSNYSAKTPIKGQDSFVQFIGGVLSILAFLC